MKDSPVKMTRSREMRFPKENQGVMFTWVGKRCQSDTNNMSAHPMTYAAPHGLDCCPSLCHHLFFPSLGYLESPEWPPFQAFVPVQFAISSAWNVWWAKFYPSLQLQLKYLLWEVLTDLHLTVSRFLLCATGIHSTYNIIMLFSLCAALTHLHVCLAQ